MSDQEVWDQPIQPMVDTVGQFGQVVQNGMDAMQTLPSGVDDIKIPMQGAASGAGGLYGMMGGLGLVSGGLTAAKGWNDISEGKSSGVYDLAGGAANSIQGATAALTPLTEAGSAVNGALGKAGGAAGAFAGGVQMVKGANELADGDAAGVGNLLQGGLNGTAGVATMIGGGAAPVAAVASAGALGMSVGNVMAQMADSDATKTGHWGKNASGKDQSAMDWGAGWGTWVDSNFGDKNPANPSIAGGFAAGLGGMVGGIGGAAHKIASWL